MKFQLTESYPGEFSALTPDERRGKLSKALSAAASDLGVAGGEIDVVVDLADVLAKAYEVRKARMLRDIAQAVLDGEG